MRTWAEQQLRYIDRFPVNFGCSMLLLYLNPISDVCFPSRMLPFIKVAWKVHPLKSVRSFFMDFWVNTAIENGSFMWFTMDLPLKDVNFPVMWKKWHFLRVANSWNIMRIPGDILVEQCNISYPGNLTKTHTKHRYNGSQHATRTGTLGNFNWWNHRFVPLPPL